MTITTIGKTSLLGISGSLRRDSYSTAILRTLQEELADRLDLRLHPLDEVPLYNQDHDTVVPLSAVAALRDAIAASDGLVIVSPEFNYGIPGVLKNALDWASRPYGAAALMNKPVLTMTASPAFTGGVRAQAQLNETLLATQSRLVLRPQTVIAQVHEKIADGRLVDPTALQFALAAVDDLVRTIRGARPLEQAA